MKRLIALFLLAALTLTGCTQNSAEPVNPLAEWLAAANLDAEETPKQLYAAALNEDMLVVYSTSTRSLDWLMGRSNVRAVDEIAQKANERYSLLSAALTRMEYITEEMKEQKLPMLASSKLSFVRDAVNALLVSKSGNDVLAYIGEYIFGHFVRPKAFTLGCETYMEFYSNNDNLRHLAMVPIYEGLSALRSQIKSDTVEEVRSGE